MMQSVPLTLEPLTADAFAPFGTVLEIFDDGTPLTPEEATLDLSQGKPRFYLMRVPRRPFRVRGLTRHRLTTQTLTSLGGRPWILAVAAPGDVEDPAVEPDLRTLRAFEIPGQVAVTMHRGCWHSGPHFDAPEMSFANLELADTNIVDHQTFLLTRLNREYVLSSS